MFQGRTRHEFIGIKNNSVGQHVYRHLQSRFRPFSAKRNFFVMRCIGRIAFPIFAFLIARGCAYTKNRSRYLLRIFAARRGFSITLCLRAPFHKANILFTLAASVAAIILLENIQSRNYQILAAVFLVLTISHILIWTMGGRAYCSSYCSIMSGACPDRLVSGVCPDADL
jgi:hypothetical protein